MKKTVILRSLILSLGIFSFYFIAPTLAYATSSIYYVKDIPIKTATYYTSDNENGTRLLWLDPGDLVVIDDTVAQAPSYTSACSGGVYYKSTYYKDKTYTGYVCSNYISQLPSTAGDDLSQFPKSYWPYLISLKLVHPSWHFTAYQTNKDWDAVLNAESVVGKSYIQDSNPIYLSLDGGSYDPDSKTYIQKETGGWYAANKNTIAYYMDPRNFLDIRNIFMFENAYFNSNYQRLEAVQNVFLLNNRATAFSPYANTFYDAATYNGNNINPITLASLSKIEVSGSNGTLSSAASGSRGYYNFYNIGAYSYCLSPVSCGNDFAYGQGWNTAEGAIKGGASFIYNNYVSVGQNTLYFQKWAVTPNRTYSNQYMTNIEAPQLESNLSFAGYSKLSTFSTDNIEFIIPVYNGMTNNDDLMPTNASRLPISVDQSKLDNITPNDGGNTPPDNQPPQIDTGTMINNMGYTYDGTYISKIATNTNVNSLVSKVQSISSSTNVTVMSNGTSKDSNSILATGDIVNLAYGSTTKSVKLVISGDVNGDGKITILDLLKVQKNLLGSIQLSDAYYKAADVDSDGNITILDLLKVQKYILGSTPII